HGIGNWPTRAALVVPGEHLRQAEVLELGGRFDHGGEHRGRLVAEAVTLHAGHDEAVVVRPDAAHLVIDRVVGPVVRGERAHAPAAEHVRPQYAPDDGARVAPLDDPRPQRMGAVGGDAAGEAAVTLAAEG